MPARPVRLDRYRNRPELHIESELVARVVSGSAAVLIAAGAVVWIGEASDRWQVIEQVRPAWFRVVQLLLAAAGIVLAAIEVAYLGYYGATGVVWRRLRAVTLAFAVVVGVWTAIFLIDRLILDGVFDV